MRSRIGVLAFTLSLVLSACGGSHQAAQPVAEPALLDQRMKEMQSELQQMRLQQEQMKQQQEQQRQQQLELLYQQRQAAAASGAAPPPPGGGAQQSAPPPSSETSAGDYFPAFQWFDPTAPKEKLDRLGNDQKL